jgi:uncharacterized protein YggT (Ycf19 family)
MADLEPGPPRAAPVTPVTPVAPVTPAAPAAPVVTGPLYNVRLVRAIWLVTAVIDVLIVIRFLLKALGASQASSFTTFIYGVTQPLVAPFQGIFPDSAHGFYVMEPADLVAIVIYALIGWALVTLVKIATSPRGTRPVVD